MQKMPRKDTWQYKKEKVVFSFKIPEFLFISFIDYFFCLKLSVCEDR